MGLRSGAGDKAAARLRGLQRSSRSGAGMATSSPTASGRDGKRGFSDACGWDWLRRVAHASAIFVIPEDWSPGWPIASVQRVHESRRHRHLDLLGWQGDATPRHSVQRGVREVFSRWPIHRVRCRRRRRQPRLRAAVSRARPSDRHFGGGRRAAPAWINGGRGSFYLSAGQMKVVDVQTQPVLRDRSSAGAQRATRSSEWDHAFA